uniref:Uncharacterized protein n=1 Tax=Ditylenchus dipsaci TaxID=166011 RepID=A0A915CVP6_9BILA
MAIKRRNMRLPAQRNRQVANEMGAPKAIPRADRSEAAIPASSMMHLSRLQSLPKVDSSQSMKASSKEDVVQQLRSLIGTYCETNVEKYQISQKAR